MNNFTLVGKIDENILRLTYICGFIAFFENCIIFIVIAELLKRLDLRQGKYDIIIQAFSVCINDTLASFMLIWMGLIRVTGNISAHVCVSSVVLSLTFQAMSQCNIVCISAFRYTVARNIRNIRAGRVKHYAKILIAVNICVFTVSLVTILATLKLYYIPDGTDLACEALVVIASNSTFLQTGIFFSVGVLCIILSVILCLMTIYRLRREINAVVHSEATDTTASSSDNTRGDTTWMSAKSRQQRAIYTMLFILLFFNISIMPMILARSLAYFGLEPSPQIKRLMFISLFLNSMFNPIIIATRIREIKRILQDSVKRISGCLIQVCPSCSRGL